VQEQADLVGGGLCARGAVGGEVTLPAFDMIFRLAPLATPSLVEGAGRAVRQAGDDEARVRPIGSRLDAGDNALDPVPACRAVVELGEAAKLGAAVRGGEARGGAGLQGLDVATERAGGGDTEQVVNLVRPAPAQHLRRAVVAVGPQQDLDPGPVGTELAHQAAQESTDLASTRPFGRAQHGGDEAALAVEHHDGLKAVFVVVRVEQAQLLPAVHGVERVVHVQHIRRGTWRKNAQ